MSQTFNSHVSELRKNASRKIKSLTRLALTIHEHFETSYFNECFFQVTV